MKREPRKVWEKRVRRWEQSGLQAKAFAAREGVSPSTLNWWRWRLRGGGVARAELPSFVEVMAAPAPRIEAAVAAGIIELVLPTGIRVELRAGFDDGELRRLLAILEDR